MILTGKNGVKYELQSGVVLGKDFLDRAGFEKAFREMLQNSESYINLRKNLAQARKIITIIKQKQKIKTITEFTSELDEITNLFSQFMFNLGGEISLLSTFNFGKGVDTDLYFLMREDELPSKKNEVGEKTYLNTKQQLKNLKANGKNLQTFNNALKKHLDDFQIQLTSQNVQTEEDFYKMHNWAYYNIKKRYNYFKKNVKNTSSVSIADYFWGKGQIHGFISESFGTHLALKHPNILQSDFNQKKFSKSVINELGGPGSVELFNLLKSSKGNTSSQLSGDIVVIKNGQVQFNIQSKASLQTSYKFNITYKKFLNDMIFFLDTYEKYIGNEKNIKKEDIDILFKKFSTEAWVPISKKLAKEIEETVEKQLIKKN